MYAGTKKRPRKVAWPNIKRVLSLIKVFDELIDDHIGHMGFVSLADKFSRLHTRLTTIQCNNLCASPTYVIFKGSYSLKWADGPERTSFSLIYINLSVRWVSSLRARCSKRRVENIYAGSLGISHPIRFTSLLLTTRAIKIIKRISHKTVTLFRGNFILLREILNVDLINVRKS